MLTIPQEIKDLLHSNRCQKNIRIHFPNGERSDICNDMIIQNSVKYTESLCSQNKLKFGICETPVLEFDVYGCENIKGMTIEAYCEIYCNANVNGAVFKNDLNSYVYPIRYGSFVVSESKRDANMQYRKVKAFSIDIPDELTQWEIKKRSFLTNQSSDYSADIYKIAMPSGISIKQDGWIEKQSGPIKQSLYSTTVTCTDQSRYHSFHIRLGAKRFTIPYSQFDSLYWVDFPKDSKKLLHRMEYTRNEILNLIQPYINSDAFVSIKTNLDNYLNTVGYGVHFEYLSYLSDFYSAESCFYPNLGLPRENGGLVSVYIVTMLGFAHIDDLGDYHWFIDPDDAGYVHNPNDFKLYEINNLNIPERTIKLPKELVDGKYCVKDISTSPRQLIGAASELSGQFFTINRYGKPELKTVKQIFNKKPEQELYPGASNFPDGSYGGKIMPYDYQKCWYDDDYIKPYGAVTCIFKDKNEFLTIYTHYFDGYGPETDPNTYSVYDISENYLISNSLWETNEIAAICQTIENSVTGVTYLPTELVCKGLPYVEIGDTLEILTKSNDSITTIVLNRTLKGEQDLTDTYKSNQEVLIRALAYTAPTWTDGSGQGITAAQLQAICNCVEGLVQGEDKAIHNISISGSVITIIFADGSIDTSTITGLKWVSNIAKTGTSGLVDTYTITFTDGSTQTFTVTNGAQGEQGEQGPQGETGEQGPAGTSVTGVELISTVGKTKTYRMSFSNGDHFDYTVTDGADGSGTGDMSKSDYDSAETVKNAGGITNYVASAISGKANTTQLDGWIGPRYSNSEHKVTFTGLNTNYGYMLTAENVDVGYKTVTVSGTSMTFEVEGEQVGITPFYLREMK